MKYLKKTIVIVLCMIMLTACGNKKNTVKETDNYEEIINLVVNANSKESVMKNYDYYEADAWELQDGELVKIGTKYLFDQYCVEEYSNGEIYFEDDKSEYHYVPEKDSVFKICYIIEDEKEYGEGIIAFSNFEFLDQDMVKSVENKDDKIVITIALDNITFIEEVKLKYDEEYDAKSIKIIFTCNKDNYLIRSMEEYIVTDDGDVQISGYKVNENSPKYSLPENILNLINGDKINEFTVIAGAGTDREKKFEFEIPYNVRTESYFGSTYENAFYFDEKYEKLYDGKTALDDGMTLYVKIK